jgi:hypothetical protein
MAALLAWQHKNLPMHVTDVQADAAGGGRTVSAQLRNESDVVACNGGWDTGDTSPLLSFGSLRSGATGSAVVTYPGGPAGLAAELRLQCAFEWKDVPSMTGLSPQDLPRMATRYPPDGPERDGIVFSLRWSPSGTWVEVNVNGRLAVVAALASCIQGRAPTGEALGQSPSP